jgi:ankyrin repeat protein
LKEIGTANRRHAYRLLQCLTVAVRPLRVDELAEILALDFDNTRDGVPKLKKDWRWNDKQEAVLSTCSSLIAVVTNGHERVVQFSHFSVKEFLTSDRLAASSPEVSSFYVLPEPAHTVIVKACLGILLQSDDGTGGVEITSSSLGEYAAKHLADHARFENVSTHIDDGLRRLFDPAKPFFKAWYKLYNLDRRWFAFADSIYAATPRGSPLYYASLCGLRNLAAHLISKHPTHVNATLGECLSPLVVALYNGHFDIAELLYQRGANVDIKSNRNRTPLQAALVDGFVDIAEWLLAHGADAMLPLDGCEIPLHFTVRTRKLEFVRMLLRHGILVDVKNKQGRTSLHLASAVENWQDEIVRLLLQLGADIDARDPGHNTPLHLALLNQVSDNHAILIQNMPDVKEQHGVSLSKTVQILLEHGADVNAQNINLSTPLHMATSLDSVETIQLLLELGADIDAQDKLHNTSLHLAMQSRVGDEDATLDPVHC